MSAFQCVCVCVCARARACVCVCVCTCALACVCTCRHTAKEVADQTCYLTQPQYTDTGPTSPNADPISPGRVATGVPSLKSLVGLDHEKKNKTTGKARIEPRSRGGRPNPLGQRGGTYTATAIDVSVG